jgi:hypothetical protein
VSAAGGAVTAGTNSVIAQTGKNFSGFNQVDWGQVGISSAIGRVAGFAGGSAGYAASNASFVVNGISSPALRSAVVSPLAAGAGHIAGGTTANLIAGQNLGDAFANSFEGLGKSMAIGGAIGVAATIGVSYANGVNPFSGKMAYPSNNGFQNEANPTMHRKGTIIDRYGNLDAYGNDNGSFVAPQGTPFDARSLPPNAINKPLNTYKVVVPIPAMEGIVAPSFWFNSGGGGIQYQFAYPISHYVNNGYLIKY